MNQRLGIAFPQYKDDPIIDRKARFESGQIKNARETEIDRLKKEQKRDQYKDEVIRTQILEDWDSDQARELKEQTFIRSKPKANPEKEIF